MKVLCAAALLSVASAAAQVIEFESNGLRYFTQSRNDVTVMFAHLPVQVRGYEVLQVAISNGSKRTWTFRPEDFQVRSEAGTLTPAIPARRVVGDFLEHGSRSDVIKLVTAYESGLYGFTQGHANNGYEQRRQQVMAEMTSTKLKAAAAASAIVFVAVKLKPGESTDGALFFPTGKTSGKPTLLVEAGGTVFQFEMDGTGPATNP